MTHTIFILRRSVALFRMILIVLFKEVDIILTPTTPNEAFGLEEKLDDPVAMYLNDVFTVPASMAGLPAMSVPCGLSPSGLPLGLQLIGPAFQEDRLFQFGVQIGTGRRL